MIVPAYNLTHLLIVISDLGDSAVIIGVVAAICLYLSWSGVPKGIWAILLSFLVALAGIGFVKMAMLGCSNHFGLYFEGGPIRSPSGHAALSVAVYGTCASLLARQTKGWRRLIPWLLASLLIAMIALTRIWLEFHNVGEVFIGFAIGGTAVLVTEFYLSRGSPLGAFNKFRFSALVLLTMIVLDGTRLPAEAFIKFLALHVNGFLPACSAG